MSWFRSKVKNHKSKNEPSLTADERSQLFDEIFTLESILQADYMAFESDEEAPEVLRALDLKDLCSTELRELSDSDLLTKRSQLQSLRDEVYDSVYSVADNVVANKSEQLEAVLNQLESKVTNFAEVPTQDEIQECRALRLKALELHMGLCCWHARGQNAGSMSYTINAFQGRLNAAWHEFELAQITDSVREKHYQELAETAFVEYYPKGLLEAGAVKIEDMRKILVFVPGRGDNLRFAPFALSKKSALFLIPELALNLPDWAETKDAILDISGLEDVDFEVITSLFGEGGSLSLNEAKAAALALR